MVHRLKLLLRSLLRKREIESELDEEVRFHLEKEIEQNIARGMSPEEARYAALRSFGGTERFKEESRDVRRGVRLVEELWQDLRYGARMLLKKPGFALIAIFTLALGIGANTAIFSVVNAVLLRPLPYTDPDRLVMVYKYYGEQDKGAQTVSAPDFLDYQQRSQLFESFAALSGGTISLTGDTEPEQVNLAVSTANFFALLKVDPLLGRHFLPDEVGLNKPKVAIISHGLWQRRFGGNPSLLGKTIQLGGSTTTVVGILPADFKLHLPSGASMLKDIDVWIPIPMDFARAKRTSNPYTVLGCLKPGVSLEQAQAEMDHIGSQLNQEHTELKDAQTRIRVVSLHQAIVKNVRPSLMILLGAVGFVLLIASANVANLMFARATARAKEIAIRAALGASRARIVRQVLTESLLLSICGGVAGLLIAYWGLELLLVLQPADLPRLENIGIDGMVLGFCLAICFLMPLLFGLPPALKASRNSMLEVLKEGGRTTAATDHKGVRRLLVIGELALSLVLLIGVGLLLKTFVSLQSVRLGFNPAKVLTFQVYTPYSRPGQPDWERQRIFFQQLEERIGGLGGVEAVGATSQLPFSGIGSWASYAWDEESKKNETIIADWRFVTPNYFRVMETKLLSGRYFTEQDDGNHPKVVIVDEVLARKAWPNETALGKKLYLPEASPQGTQRQWVEVVGVIEPPRSHKLTEHTREQFYIPYAQNPAYPSMYLAVRTKVDPTSLMSAIKKEAQALDKDVPVYKVRMMEEYVSDAMASARFNLILMGIFGLVAVVLASVGLYGVISFWISQRTHEMGVRMALGAQPRDIFKLVVGQGIRLTLFGTGVGVAAAFILTRYLTSQLFGVSATDPLTFSGVVALLTIITLVACYFPARRATKIDPLVALRDE